ncbi:MAG: ketopantoate reductase family protein [Thermoplasmatota archaeon]
MRVLVFGAGSVGSFFGGLLSERYDVTLLGRKQHMEAIERNGLRITGRTEKVLHPRVWHSLGDLNDIDLIILTVKAYNTESAMRDIVPYIREDTMVLSLQNGLDNVETIRRVMKKEGHILAGITSHGVMRAEDGHIVHAGAGETVLGDVVWTERGRVESVAQMLNSVGIQTRTTQNICGEMWAKAIVNAGINPITAITGLQNGYLLRVPALTALLERTCSEAMMVAEAARIRLPPCNIIEKTKDVARKTAENKSSMLQDIERGRRTEICSINGYISEVGKRHGVDTPVNSTLTALVKGIEETAGAR